MMNTIRNQDYADKKNSIPITTEFIPQGYEQDVKELIQNIKLEGNNEQLSKEQLEAIGRMPVVLDQLTNLLAISRDLMNIIFPSVQQYKQKQDHRVSTLSRDVDSPVFVHEKQNQQFKEEKNDKEMNKKIDSQDQLCKNTDSYTSIIDLKPLDKVYKELDEQIMKGRWNNRNLSSPYRMTTTRSVRVPSLHINKELLTRDDVADILFWLAERVEGQDPEDLLEQLSHDIVGSENPMLIKIINALGEQLYGPNNYIGPGKTGATTPMSIIEAVTTFPALSKYDAEARAHDILSTVSDNPIVDTVLSSPIMRQAQIVRPIGFTRSNNRDQKVELLKSGIEPNPGPKKNENIDVHYFPHTRYCPGRGIREYTIWFMIDDENISRADRIQLIRLLLRRAGIETNPGPKELTTGELVDEMMEDASKPTMMEGMLNLPANSVGNDYMNETLRHGTYLLRSGVDDRSDQVLPDSNWSEVACIDRSDLVAPALVVSELGARRFSYSINNRFQKITGNLKPSTNLGIALGSALQVWSEFTASQRTANNVVNGDASLGIYERMTSADFGNYIECAKLLAYQIPTMLAAGTVGVAYEPDVMTRIFPTTLLAGGAIKAVFPLSENVAPAGFAIQSIALTLNQYKQWLTGEIIIPGMSINDQETTGTVFVDPGATPQTLALRAINTLEFPFLSIRTKTAETVGMAVGNATPVVFPGTPGGAAYNYERCKITGAKTSVIYIRTSNDANPVNIDNGIGGTFAVPLFPAVSVNIFNAISTYFSSNWGNTSVFAGYSETLDYYMKMMDSNDWRATMLLYAAIARTKIPYQPYYFTVGASVTRIPISNAAAVSPPTIDAQVQTNVISSVGRSTDFLNAIYNVPGYTCLGFPDAFTGEQPPVGTSINPPIPYTATLQDNASITDFSVFTGVLMKETLFGSSIAEVAKTNYRRIWIAGKRLGETCVQASAEYYLNLGVTNIQMYSRGAMVIDQRTSRRSKINELWCLTQQKYCGFFAIWQNYIGPVGNEANPGATAFWNYDAWLNSPIILHNTIWDELVKSRWGDWKPDTTYQLQSVIKDYDPVNLPVTTVSGVPVAGQVSLKIGDINNARNKKMTSTAHLFWAMSQTTHLLNVNPFNILLSVWTGAWNTGQVLIQRPIIMWLKEFLRWTSAIVDSSQFRNGVRPVLGVTLPQVPSSEWCIGGVQIGIYVQSQATISSLRQGYNIRGVGSADFNLTSAYHGLYEDDLTLAATGAGYNF